MSPDRQDPAQGNPPPSWRKPAGMLLILLLIAGWTAIIVSLSPWNSGWWCDERVATKGAPKSFSRKKRFGP